MKLTFYRNMTSTGNNLMSMCGSIGTESTALHAFNSKQPKLNSLIAQYTIMTTACND